MQRILTLLSCCLVTMMSAQNVPRNVNATAGGTIQTEDFQIDWTLGEMSISSFEANDFLLTEGFQQPMLTVEQVGSDSNFEEITSTESATSNADDIPEVDFDYQVNIFPNPFKATLNIEVQSKALSAYQFELLDLHGKSIVQKKEALVNSTTDLKVDKLLSGLYYLRIFTTDGQCLETHKVVRSY